MVENNNQIIRTIFFVFIKVYKSTASSISQKISSEDDDPQIYENEIKNNMHDMLTFQLYHNITSQHYGLKKKIKKYIIERHTEDLAFLMESTRAVTAPVSLAVSSNCCVKSRIASSKSTAASSTAGCMARA